MKIIFLLQLKPNWNPLKIVRRRQILLLTIQGKKNSTNPQTDRKRRLQFRKCFFFSSQGGERSWWGATMHGRRGQSWGLVGRLWWSRGMIGDNWRMVASGEGAPGFFCGGGVCCTVGGLRRGMENRSREGKWGVGSLGSSMRVGGIAIWGVRFMSKQMQPYIVW